MTETALYLETLMTEMDQPEEVVLAAALRTGLRQLWREYLLDRYLRRQISRSEAIESVGIDWVELADRQLTAAMEDVHWALAQRARRLLAQDRSSISLRSILYRCCASLQMYSFQKQSGMKLPPEVGFPLRPLTGSIVLHEFAPPPRTSTISSRPMPSLISKAAKLRRCSSATAGQFLSS